MTTASIIAPLLMADSYKASHPAMGAPGRTKVLSNYTNRTSRIPGVYKVVHFGLQAFCQKYLVEEWEPFFEADQQDVCDEYQRFMGKYLGVDPATVDVAHVRGLHALGYLPLRVCGLLEGTRVPLRVPSFTLENTHDDFDWITNYVETMLSASVWHPSTTATIANEYRSVLERWAEATGAPVEAVDFQGHDFSFRGQTSVESAAASGAGHLLAFTGSDTMISVDYIERYYPGDNDPIAMSVPASEHSIMSVGGPDGELDTYRRLLETYPTGIVSIVSDTYDLFGGVIGQILPALKDEIMARDGKLVIRPDSGDPVTILTGDPSAPEGSPEYLGVVRLLGELFGTTTNAKGFKALDPHIGVIYGDSITLDRAQRICERLAWMGYESTSVVLGIGSFTYQYVTRDTFGSAVKATWVEVDGEGRAIFKDPKTDSGMKKSATGRLAVHYDLDRDDYVLVENATPEDEKHSLLRPVWEDGKFVRMQSFADVRETLRLERD